MVDALKDKKIDVTFRGLASKDIVSLRSKGADSGLQLVEGAGMEISYLVVEPEGSVGQEARGAARRSPRSSTVRRSRTRSTRTRSTRCTPWSPRA